MKLAWLTDIHLNFLNKKNRRLFYEKIINCDCDAVLISGDIAEASCLIEILEEMANYIKKKIYFILGNHDYYGSEINEVRQLMMKLTQEDDQLFWLPASGMQILNNDTILLGQDGWADGRLGDYQNSNIVLNDSRMIVDLFQAKIFGKLQLLEKMQQLADMDAMALEDGLNKVIKHNPKRIIVLTHVPPFKEACMYNGKYSDANWLPYFSSKVMGDKLIQVAERNLSVEFLVLCGHTHGKAEYNPFDNLTVMAGSAEYNQPEIQKLITID